MSSGRRIRDFSRTQYYHEFDRRDSLAKNANTPVLVIIALSGGLATIVANLNTPLNIGDRIVAFFVVLSAAFIILSVLYLSRSLIGFEYGFLPTPKELDLYLQQLKFHYRDNRQMTEKMLEKKCDEYLGRCYTDLAGHNAKNNDQKSYFLHMANVYLVAALALGLAALLTFSFELLGISVCF